MGLIHRDAWNQLAEVREGRNEYGPIPDAAEFQRIDCGYQVPAKVHGWQWSTTFGRWSALVTFPDGWHGFTYPRPPSMNYLPDPAGPALPIPLALRNPAKPSPEDRARRRETLRSVHLEIGVDDRYLSLPDGQRLWFVSVCLDREVHCRGYTRSLHEFALGADSVEAQNAVLRFLAHVAPEVKALQCKAMISSSADHPEELAFPDQVRRLDMPPLPIRTSQRKVAG